MSDGFYELHPIRKTVKAKLHRHHDRCLIFRHSHIAITDYHLGDNKEFEKSLSVWDDMKWKYKRMAGYYVQDLHEFRLPRGYDLEQLAQYFKGYHVIVDNDDAIGADKIDISLMVPPKDDSQRMAITFLCNQEEFKKNSKYTSHMIDVNTGGGKEQPDNTVIPTPYGNMLLCQLEAGDVVYNRRREPVPILAIYPQEPSYPYTITLEDGRSTRCGRNHLWNVIEVPMDGVPKFTEEKTVTLGEIMEHFYDTIYFVPIYTEETGFEPYTHYRRIISIDVDNREKVPQRCIMLDDDEHLYITEDDIITHNTYCSVASSCFMQARTIVVAPISKLLEQWKKTYLDFTSLKDDEILIVQGSKTCKKILDGKYENVKIFIFSIDTIVSFVERYGDLECIEMFEKTRAYLKVFDEVHLDMKAVNLVEALCNTKHTIYASASPGRSQKKENWIFRNCYRHVPRFGSKFTVQDEKYLDIMVVPYKWVPTAAQIKRMVNGRTKWLNSNVYERELFSAPREQTGDFFNKLEAMLKWSSKIVKGKNKILIMCGTVEGTKTIMEIAEEIFPGECTRYYGDMKEKEKTEALKKRIICATGQSLGTGADIKGIQHVYNVSTYSNWINANQKPGRARKLEDGTQVVYIELVNFGYMKTVRQYEKRRPELIKKTRSGQLILIQ